MLAMLVLLPCTSGFFPLQHQPVDSLTVHQDHLKFDYRTSAKYHYRRQVPLRHVHKDAVYDYFMNEYRNIVYTPSSTT